MGIRILILLAFIFLGACSSTPKMENTPMIQTLSPDPEVSLQMDDQFLMKSQRISAGQSSKKRKLKTLLQP